jgi:hypothetical protein
MGGLFAVGIFYTWSMTIVSTNALEPFFGSRLSPNCSYTARKTSGQNSWNRHVFSSPRDSIGQFPMGVFSMWSMTRTCTETFFDSSLSPSCDCKALKISGSGSGADASAGTAPPSALGAN